MICRDGNNTNIKITQYVIAVQNKLENRKKSKKQFVLNCFIPVKLWISMINYPVILHH